MMLLNKHNWVKIQYKDELQDQNKQQKSWLDIYRVYQFQGTLQLKSCKIL